MNEFYKKRVDIMSEDYIEKEVADKKDRVSFGLNPLSIISTNFIKKAGSNSKGSFLQKDIMINWKSIVGEAFYEQIKPVKLAFKSKNHAVLEVALKSSSLAGIIQYEKQNIIDKVNAFTGNDVVKDIKFMHGK
ncbi:MAG: DUF721 domain-containing protein [Alphaproteobacteria bacterium]|jgi:hypothetical protein|nr:DUF721 domain-containing protein [Alphaproteobacteria bacterium]